MGKTTVFRMNWHESDASSSTFLEMLVYQQPVATITPKQF